MNRLLSVREQKIFIVCVSVVLTAVFYNGLVVPLQRESGGLDEEITVRRQELKRDGRIIQKARQVQVRHDAYLNRFGKQGTSEEAVSSFLSDIEKVAGRLKLTIGELKPRKVVRHEWDDRFSVKLTFNSDFVDIVHFLYTVQQEPYLFDVEEVEFNKLSRRNQGGIATSLVLGKSFILTGGFDKEDLAL